MKILPAFFACAIAVSSIGLAQAQSLTQAPTVFSAGKWKVVRSVDQMTDETSCTGIYNNDYGIQLSEYRLFVNSRGGIRSVRLRFDDDPARDLRLATAVEKRLGSVIITDNDFISALKATRLRVEIINQTDDILFRDIDTTDMIDARDNIREGCPLTKAGATPGGTSSATTPKISEVPVCNEALLLRMKAAKVTPEQISTICHDK